MRVLVTGAAGFIGSHVCARLSEDHDVVGIDDLSTGDRSNLDGIDIEFVEGSILDPDALATAASGADSVVHLAAIPSVPRSMANPLASHDAIVTGTLRVLEVARALDDPLVVMASSSSVYGANPELPKHERMTPMPMSPYAGAKLAAEQYCTTWSRCFGLRTLPFRFFNVYGSRQTPGHAYAAVVPAFVDAALAGRPIPVHGDGTQSRDFTYVGTVVDVIADALRRDVATDGPVNLAFGTRSTLLDVIELLETQLGRELEREHSTSRVGDVPHSQADHTLLDELFPTIVP
ncbi:MAG: NAD-dependent epimerase/dehydratase family protein, partial [Ilumatobacter sp.]